MPNNDYTVTLKGTDDGSLPRAIQDASDKLDALAAKASSIALRGIDMSTVGGPAFAPPTPAGSSTAAGAARSTATTAPPIAGQPNNPLNIPQPVQHPQNAINNAQALYQAYQPGYANNPLNAPAYNRLSGYNASVGPSGIRVRGRFGADELLGLEAGYAATRLVGQSIGYAADRTLNGGDDPMARMGLVTGGLSAGLGLAAGFATANPMVGLAVAGMSSAVLDPLGRFLAAPEANRQAASQSLRPFLSAYAGRGADGWNAYFTDPGELPFGVLPGSPRAGQMTRLGRMSGLINQNLPPELQMDAYGKQLGATVAAVSSGLYAGGFNPFDPSGQRVMVGADDRRGQAYDRGRAFGLAHGYGDGSGDYFKGSLNGAFGPMNRTAGTNVGFAPGAWQQDFARPQATPAYAFEETLAETISRRIGKMFGNESPGAAKRMAPLYGSLPETGNNTADMLMRYGAEDTLTYLRLQNDDATSSVDPMVLSRTSAGVRAGNRLARLSATRARGKGSAIEQALNGQMASLEGIPDGKDSLTYAELGASRRSARLQAFEEQGAATTGLEAVRLSGQRDRFNLMPYSPGNIIGNQIAMSKNAGREANRIGAYLTAHKGELSEEQTLQLESRRQGQLTQSWEAAAMLSEGMTNRLPALSSNAPAGIGVQRFTSWTLAAKNADLMGIPSREWGAISGSHLARQNALFANMGGTASMSNATSTTAGFNTSAETNGLLREIAGILRGLGGGLGGGGGSGNSPRAATGSLGNPNNPLNWHYYNGRPDEYYNNMQGQLDRRDVDSIKNKLYSSTN